MSLALAGGDWAAVLLPEQGGALARLAHRGRDVLVPLPAGADPHASFAGGFLMAPWVNRLDAGRVGDYGMVPVNRPGDGTAIHGLLRDAPWRVAEQRAERVVLQQAGAGGPWCWRARLTVSLGDTFELALTLENAGVAPMVFGSGWHPFFARPPGTRLRFTATTRCRHDARMLPEAVEPCTGIDGDALDGLDTAFAGWDGVAEITRPDLTLRLTATDAWARHLQVFAPKNAGILCVEPVSHLPDAVNRPWLGAMDLLAPGEALTGAVRLAVA